MANKGVAGVVTLGVAGVIGGVVWAVSRISVPAWFTASLEQVNQLRAEGKSESTIEKWIDAVYKRLQALLKPGQEIAWSAEKGYYII